jgi:cytochrome c6
MFAMALLALSSSAVYGFDAAAGKAVYDAKCKTCHGADGTPNAGVAKMMKVEMKDLKTVKIPDAETKAIITNGKGKMKPVAGVTGASLDDVVAYIKTLK